MASARAPARPLAVALLAYDGLCWFEFACAREILGAAPRGLAGPWYELRIVGESRRGVRIPGSGRLPVKRGLEALAGADIVVVPGWRALPVPARVARALRAAHERGARMVSICTGALALAAAGVLAARRATTHWRDAHTLAALDPTIEVDEGVLYVDDGDVITSAGSSAGIDMLIHMVARDFGRRAANAVARELVIPAHREGDQRQFIERPVQAPADDRLARVMRHVRGNLPQRHTVAQLAARAAMSPRSFYRHFRQATGLTPIDWVVRERVLAARQLLDGGQKSVKALAQAAGFGSPEVLRHHFRRIVGVSPTGYRRAAIR
jgi:AraC family transcriptional activator FtrA